MSFSRYPGERSNRGRISTTPGASTPAPPGPGPTDLLTIITSVTPYFLFSGDLGITLGTGVAAWADQIPASSLSAAQATGTAQPALVTGDLNGRNVLQFDNLNVQRLTIATLNLPAPGTTPLWWFVVANRTLDVSLGALVSGGGTTVTKIFRSAATTVSQGNGVSVNATTMTVGSWYRIESLFNNAVADYLKVGATTVTGAVAGANDPPAGGVTFGARISTGTDPGAYKLAFVAAYNGEPTAGEKANASAWVTSYYGAGVNV